MTKKKRVVVGRSENTGDQVTIRQRKEFLRLEERGQVNKGVMQWIIDNISKIRELAGVKCAAISSIDKLTGNAELPPSSSILLSIATAISINFISFSIKPRANSFTCLAIRPAFK